MAKQRKKEIAIISYYFGGVFPDWFLLYRESVLRNPTIDFFIYTDCPYSGMESDNLHFVPMQFSEYIKLAERRLGIPLRFKDRYKFCDLAPFYGYIHYSDIKDYDYYGIADIDLIFGDIRQFYTPSILNRYDVFSTHSTCFSGHFLLFKNKKTNLEIMVREIENWEAKLQIEPCLGLAETYLYALYLKEIEKQGSSKIPIWSWIRARKAPKLYLQEQYSTPFTPFPWIDGSTHSNHPSQWYYRNGVITNDRDGNRQFMYLHFMNFKNAYYRHDGTAAPWQGLKQICHAEPKDMAHGISISSKGIFPLSSLQ